MMGTFSGERFVNPSTKRAIRAVSGTLATAGAKAPKRPREDRLGSSRSLSSTQSRSNWVRASSVHDPSNSEQTGLGPTARFGAAKTGERSMFDEHVMCRACGSEMRIRSVEPMARLTRVLFQCVEDQCGRQCHIDLPRRERAPVLAA
jgi:hypothetical protein